MNSRCAYRALLALAACGAVFAASAPDAAAYDRADGMTAVSSEVAKGYARARLPDGSYQPESYAFGNGGYMGGPFPDKSMDQMSFLDVAGVVAVPLAEQKYFPAKDPNTTKLLIMLYWGTTITPGRPEGDEDNIIRDRIDYQNAQLLGYDSEGLVGTVYGSGIELTALRWHRRDLVIDLEYNRYYVVLMAYDFQILRSQKKLKPMWETRFSLNERGNQFDKALPAMAKIASHYFGEDSKGLVRRPVPTGQVDIGEPTLIELLPANPK
jgi:hypothetical protein